jgi:putative nucleotidyltransferase with HDIG domain
MRTIKNLAELDYSLQETIDFEATVLDVLDEGLEERKRPMRISLRLEESGEVLQAISWTYNLLQLLKDAAKSTDIVLFEALSGVFSNKQEQIRVGNAKLTGKQSTKKVLKSINVLETKRDIQTLINRYITTPIIKNIIEELIMNEPKFFEWPAATKVHHAYEGGLAFHSLSVARNAISLWENYKGENIDSELVVAGALIHDLGKLSEYNKDGSRTLYGDLVSHLVDGSERISEFCWKKGINPTTDKKVVILKHIVLSHHERPDFGAAVKPAVLEAYIVARADAIDAVYESINGELQNITSGQTTDRLTVTEGTKIIKWK